MRQHTREVVSLILYAHEHGLPKNVAAKRLGHQGTARYQKIAEKIWNNYNDELKNNTIIETPVWRNIQRLGDLRNLCDHIKKRDPGKDEVQELINGVLKLTKTLF